MVGLDVSRPGTAASEDASRHHQLARGKRPARSPSAKSRSEEVRRHDATPSRGGRHEARRRAMPARTPSEATGNARRNATERNFMLAPELTTLRVCGLHRRRAWAPRRPEDEVMAMLDRHSGGGRASPREAPEAPNKCRRCAATSERLPSRRSTPAPTQAAQRNPSRQSADGRAQHALS